ncbi:MAG: cold shock domain-containing protein [Acidobacteriota bacterium]
MDPTTHDSPEGKTNAAEGVTTEGVVKWYSLAKGYGFIDDSEGRDVFVHHSVILDPGELVDGDRVRFERVPGERGPLARDVQRIGR